MSRKSYFWLIKRKKGKFISRLIRHFNDYKDHFYQKTQLLHESLQHKFYNKKDAFNGNWKNKADLLSKMVITTTANGIFETLIKDIPQKGLFTNKSSLALKKEWFSSYKFSIDTFISKKKYKYRKSKHKTSLYFFND